MAQYIDKSALVAEIEKRMSENEKKQSLPQFFGMLEEDLGLTDFINSLEVKENPVSIWHDASETPTDKSKVIVWLGEELNEIVQCHYKYGKFVEKIPTEEYGKYVLVGNAIEGYSRQFVSNKKRADITELVVKWAYIDDLFKL